MTPPPNAAFYYAPDNYQTAGDGVVGRQSATGGFLKGFIHHAGVDKILIYADQAQVFEQFRDFVAEAGGDTDAIGAYLPANTAGLSDVGTLFRPGPDVGSLAWRRRHFDPRGFSIAGITHTVCETMAMQVIGDLLVAPVQPWDALVCTSACVKGVVTRLLDGHAAYLSRRFGAEVTVPLELPIIPLGVDADAMAARGSDQAARADLRGRMGINEADIALLYAGRLNHVEKANPIPMHLAAETAAQSSGRRLHLIQAGQATNKDVEDAFKQAATSFAPSVNHHFIDGSMTELYDMIWAAADIFISLSDNIQESFGLTPIEAMAAGLPVIVSDYDGYRESVRHGEDGLAVPTAQPPAGAGAEAGFLYDTGNIPYPVFTAATSQSTAADVAAAADAIVTLIGDPALRRKMGGSGQARAREVYDWRHVVAGHQALWQDLADIRAGAGEAVPLGEGEVPHPLAADPFHLFRDHATVRIEGTATVTAIGGADSLKAFLASDIAAPLAAVLMDEAATAALLEDLAASGPQTAAHLAAKQPPERLTPFYLTLGWLAKVGLVRIEAGDGDGPDTPAPPFGASETWKRLMGG
ncbi:MAG: glycosyltransferase family 4 protein [Magnetovibrio sp.]|nr:glycosyltransferase family 4 protein [Magnetovibrio sp.]